jgi:cytochrome oxidase Cu insertion factor (SCO1/SenC/PrrC family)
LSRRKAQRMSRRRARRKRSWVETLGFAAIGAFIIAMIWLAFFTSPQTPSQTTTPSLAADFALTDVDGAPFRLSDQRGKVVVLEFMRTTCPACMSEDPYLRELRSRFGSNVVMVSVSVDPAGDTESVLRAHRNQNLPGWIAIRDTSQVVQTTCDVLGNCGGVTYLRSAYGVQGTPTIFIIDKNGYIQYHHVELTQSSVLIGEVENLV